MSEPKKGGIIMQNEEQKKIQIKAVQLLCIGIFLVAGILALSSMDKFSEIFSVLAGVTSSILYGLVFAFLLNPFVNFLESRMLPMLLKRMKKPKMAHRISRVAGLLFALSITALILYAFILVIVPEVGASIIGIVENMPAYYKSIESTVLSLLEDNPDLGEYAYTALEKGYIFFDDFLRNDLLANLQVILVGLTSSVYMIISVVFDVVIGIIVAIYIILSKDKFMSQAKKMTVAFWKINTANYLLDTGRRIYKIFTGFVIGKIIDSLIIGVLCYVGVSILKLPYPMLISTVIGLTNVIPYFGPFIGAIPCALLILLISPIQSLYFIIFILVLQQIDGNIIGPSILGDNVGISAIWILISITVGGGLFGFTGMLLGVPVFAVIYMLIDDLVNHLLKKKNMSTKTTDYFTILAAEDLPIAIEEKKENS